MLQTILGQHWAFGDMKEFSPTLTGWASSAQDFQFPFLGRHQLALHEISRKTPVLKNRETSSFHLQGKYAIPIRRRRVVLKGLDTLLVEIGDSPEMNHSISRAARSSGLDCVRPIARPITR